MHSMALSNLGELFSWGSNSFGQIGDGSDFEKFSPFPININNKTIKSISTGLYHTLSFLIFLIF
jgi:alpha-tubulin suppressor-like RCC1 family protein